jgi:short-subunit dehydrogenase
MKVIVITGASGGIGAELARQLGAQGHRLVLAARRQKELEEVAGPLGAVAVVTDVTRRADVEALRDRALAACGSIDVWINNAGRGINKKVLDLTDADFDEMMTVNTKSALYGMQAVVPYFQQRGAGHLINVSSFLGRVPMASFRSVYSASKAALNSLTTNLRMDLQQDYPNLHVSIVMPAMVATDFHQNALGGLPNVSLPPGAPQAQSVEEVAAAIVRLVEHPVPEIYTNPASPAFARRFFDSLGAFS